MKTIKGTEETRDLRKAKKVASICINKMENRPYEEYEKMYDKRVESAIAFEEHHTALWATEEYDYAFVSNIFILRTK